uniref:alpha-mannosidase n=1 Tax=Globicatella sp. PHS-GS-PNBC-21-1553 TaxID=2885764 RepID=UPI00298F14C8|nr:glycoside hydrolase family 38 C-terminal domain-containing protein [Globicatella sp. PHS-GS-PNBC-21-1553]WPC09041.1 glycosyl hydrolase-related protein [Globicatella sp. PHS-GS-PNBC-21-1553]
MFEFEYIRKQYYKLANFIKKEEYPIHNVRLVKGDLNEDYVLGTYFGQKNNYYTLLSEIKVPQLDIGETFWIEAYSSLTEWDNSTNPQLKLYLNEELIQGLDVNHRHTVVPEKFWGQKVSMRLEIFSGREEKQFPMYIKAYKIDQATYNTYWDFRVAVEAWQAIEEDSYKLIYQETLLKCTKLLDFRQVYSDDYYQRLETIQSILQLNLYQKFKELSSVDVYAIGHTHIDLAWLWTFQQAIEKGERSFSTILKFMEDYPNFTFIQSQPQLYQDIKEQYPELYQLIQTQIKEGRWIPEGAMWVESDTNLISGESMVRQFLYGKQYFKNELGIESKICWLPDVFGYSPTLPQIMAKTNTPYFMTTKLSWNQMNQIPNDSFTWKGLDGSEVLVHFIPTVSVGYSPTPFYTTYNGMLDPLTLKKSWDRYINKDKNNFIMNAYGYGDGGGGPTIEMLETAQRLENGLPGIPKVKNSNALDFFENLEKSSEKQNFNTWVGELYFEYHRGTYTSIGKIKRQNRFAEFYLQNIEKLYTLYKLENYPKSAIENLWKIVLKHQFHDVLPGSSIQEVYDEADSTFEKLFASFEQLYNNLFPSPEEKNDLIIFNPNGISQSGYIQLKETTGSLLLNGQKELESQQLTNHERLYYLPNLKPLSTVKVGLEETKSEEVDSRFKYNDKTRQLETPYYCVEFDKDYQIISLYDKEVQRMVNVDRGLLNELVVYEDIPMDYDAWDIDIYYPYKRWTIHHLNSVKVKENGSLIFSLLIERHYQHSTIQQEMIFHAYSRRIDFKTEVDWQENQQLLRAEFNVDIHAYESTHDIQFGNIRRPVHRNTSWDIAKFETCAHKWIDLSEEDYGCALMSDCKYGYNTEYQKFGISLIKSPIDPYPKADIGYHQFSYSLYPHQGDWKNSDVVAESYQLNNPLVALPVAENQQIMSPPIEFENDAIIIDTLKQSEDGKGIIVRLFDFKGRRTKVNARVISSYTKVYECNLLEEVETELRIDSNNQFICEVKPYEIKTIKLM